MFRLELEEPPGDRIKEPRASPRSSLRQMESPALPHRASFDGKEGIVKEA